ncbi:hypothetical protein ACN47E_002681 [Coniothyrium glycines]
MTVKLRDSGWKCPSLPPETLQTIFRELGSSDLLQCQQVCKEWRNARDSRGRNLLHELFLKAKEREAEEIPTVIIRLKAPVDLVQETGKLPHVTFGLEVYFLVDAELMHSDFEPHTGFDEEVEFHSILKFLEEKMHFVNPCFRLIRALSNRPIFTFNTMEDLEIQTQLTEDWDYKDGDWRDELLCEPMKDKVRVEYRWPGPRKRTFILEAEEDEGVTVGMFVDSMRAMFKNAAKDVKSFTKVMAVGCENCTIDRDAELWTG